MNSETLLYWFVRSILKTFHLKVKVVGLEFDLVFETMLWSYELLNIDRLDRDKVSQRTPYSIINFQCIAKLSPSSSSTGLSWSYSYTDAHKLHIFQHKLHIIQHKLHIFQHKLPIIQHKLHIIQHKLHIWCFKKYFRTSIHWDQYWYGLLFFYFK